MDFVLENRPSVIEMDFCLSFIRFLYEKGYAAAMIKSIKSSLKRPITYAFDIDLNSELFNMATKACSNLRPSVRPMEISWSLTNVLEIAASTGPDCVDLTMVTGKAVFLVMLALGARLSEVAALRRGDKFIKFLLDGSVRLSPDKVFMAKNEGSDVRWEPWILTPLPENPSLCPVASLIQYLALTGQIKTGQLFRGETGGSNLSIKLLRSSIICLVNTADPAASVETESLRNMEPLNFIECLNFQDVTKFTGWQSRRVFYRHYLEDVPSLSGPVVAAGKVVHPDLLKIVYDRTFCDYQYFTVVLVLNFHIHLTLLA